MHRVVGVVLVGMAMAVTAVAVTVAASSPAVADGNEAPVAAARALSAGGYHTCAVLENGQVRCWGYNGSGQLGLGDTESRGDGSGELGDALPVVDLGTGRTATAVAAGGSHTCALLDGGEVKCWGSNGYGQLGLGDTLDRGYGSGPMGDALPVVDLGTGRTATAISAGDSHTCALLDNGQVKCWGYNSAGLLGLGNTAARGDAPGEMGDALPAVDLGTGRTATAVTAGYGHTCALLDDGTVKCWGSGVDGRLGSGNTVARGDGPGEMGDALPVVALGTGRTATAVSAGGAHTCAVLDDGGVKCWGAGGRGRLGTGGSSSRGDGAGEMGDALVAADLGAGRTATGVSASDASTCVLLDDGAVKCWGYNGYGQLGQGDVVDRGDDSGEMGDALPPVDLGTGRTAVAATTGANDHTCALLDTGRVKCWGDGAYGQLGAGDATYRGDEAGEMGDSLPVADLGAGRLVGPGATRRPDAHLRKGTASYVGLDLYNTNGANQSRAGTTGGSTVSFTVRIENDGTVTDRFRVTGAGGTTRFTVAYRRGTTTITNQVTRAGYATPDLAPGASMTVTVRITPTGSARPGSRISRLLTIGSVDGAEVDAVKATVERV